MNEIPDIYYTSYTGVVKSIEDITAFELIDGYHGVAYKTDLIIRCKEYGQRGWFVHSKDSPAIIVEFSDGYRYFFYNDGHNVSIDDMNIDDDIKVCLTLKYALDDVGTSRIIRYR